MKTKSLLALTVALVMVIGSVASLPASADASGLTLTGTGIYRPDMKNEISCSRTSVTVSNTLGGPIVNGNYFSLQYKVKSDTQSGMFLPGDSVTVSSTTAGASSGSIALGFQICTYLINMDVPGGNANKVQIQVTESRGLTQVAVSTIEIPILDKSVEEQAISDLRNKCQGWFSVNTLVEQTVIPKKSGKTASIAGTLLRKGYVSPNDTVTFLQEVPLKNGKTTLRPLGTAITNQSGEFYFNFKLKRNRKEFFTNIKMVVPDRQTSIGPLEGPFAGKEVWLYFEWKKAGAIYQSSYNPDDWVPEVSSDCYAAYVHYDRNVASDPNRKYNDSNNGLKILAAGANYLGTFGKRRVDGPNLTSGCIISVRGYTTKKGKRVRPHTRSC